MRAYLLFLRRHPLWWIVPIAIYLGALTWVAGGVSRTPENPFNYSAR